MSNANKIKVPAMDDAIELGILLDSISGSSRTITKYQGDFQLFLYDCVATIDQARAGQIRKWPRGPGWDEYWEDFTSTVIRRRTLLVDKTRRVMASNLVCALDLWLMLGGRDKERPNFPYGWWPALALSSSRRAILLQSKKLEGVGGSAEFLTKIKDMYTVSMDQGLGDKWPGVPSIEFHVEHAEASNGSKIQAVPQGADHVRGPGATLLHAEELSFWDQAEATIQTAIPALNPDGHLIAVTTPKPATYAARLRKGEISRDMYSDASGRFISIPPKRLKTPAGKLPLYQVGDWAVLEIRGVRDVPGYDPREVGRGITDPQAYAQEVEGDWTAASGKLVYPQFGPKNKAIDPLEFDPERPLICGWDLPGAGGGTPAMVPCQLSAFGQLYVWECLVGPSNKNQSFYDFIGDAAQYLYDKFARPYGLYIRKAPFLRTVHVGDPAGMQKPPRTSVGGHVMELRSAFEIIRDGQDEVTGFTPEGNPIITRRPGWGWRVTAANPSLTLRQEATKNRLCLMAHNALPGIIVDPGARTMMEAFGGGYHYRQRADGRYELDPYKNEYSHPMNALEYVCGSLSSLNYAEMDSDASEHRNPQPAFVPHGRRAR